MDADLDLCGGIYPKGARHNGLLCEPDGRAAPCPARALCIRRRYVGCRHTQQPAQPTTHCQNDVRARHVQTTLAPAACERRALDGVAASCEAMKRDGVKRLRQRRETSVLQRASRWRLYAFGALPDYPCSSRQRTASPWRGIFREGRSGEVAAGTERTRLERSYKQRAVSSPSALCPMPVR